MEYPKFREGEFTGIRESYPYSLDSIEKIQKRIADSMDVYFPPSSGLIQLEAGYLSLILCSSRGIK